MSHFTCGLMLILFPTFCPLSTPHGISTARSLWVNSRSSRLWSLTWRDCSVLWRT